MDDVAKKVKALRESLNWNQARLAKEIGVDQSTVAKYENGKMKPKDGPNHKLADLAGVSYGEWTGIEPVATSDFNAKMIRVYGELCAGSWREATEWDYEDTYETPAILDPDMPPYPLKGYRVVGTSMNKIYPNGSVVFAAATISNGLNPKSGDHVLVSRRNKRGQYEASLKVYVVNPDGSQWLWPDSHDPEHQAPLQYKQDAEEVVITGVVQGAYITAPKGRS